MTDDGPRLTFGPKATNFVLEAFGWEMDRHGFVVDEDGRRAPSYDGESIHYSEVAGVVGDEYGNPVLLRDDFNVLVEFVKDERVRRNPCGEYHPLPCGLDEECPVPVEYHDASKTSEEIHEAWETGD